MLTAENDNERLVLQFLDDWSTSDADLLASRFTEDGYYWNIPGPSAKGRDNVRQLLQTLFSLRSFRMENLGMASKGNTVYVERIDHLTFPDGRTLPLRVFGVFEIEGGLIKEWREYFDRATVTRFSEGGSADEETRFR
jgi:limonene-1,2-epoxide hydrolase